MSCATSNMLHTCGTQKLECKQLSVKSKFLYSGNSLRGFKSAILAIGPKSQNFNCKIFISNDIVNFVLENISSIQYSSLRSL